MSLISRPNCHYFVDPSISTAYKKYNRNKPINHIGNICRSRTPRNMAFAVAICNRLHANALICTTFQRRFKINTLNTRPAPKTCQCVLLSRLIYSLWETISNLYNSIIKTSAHICYYNNTTLYGWPMGWPVGVVRPRPARLNVKKVENRNFHFLQLRDSATARVVYKLS